MKNWILLYLLITVNIVKAQTDPEFPKGTVIYLSVQQGKSTSFDLSPDLWVGGIAFSPQYTVVPKHLRIGAVAEYVYTDKHSSGLFGPRLALKLKTIRTEPLGSLLNFQLQTDLLWGTRKQRLVGGGFAVEIFQLLTFNLTTHRDYVFSRWWFRAGIGVNLLHKRKSGSTDPLSDEN